MRTNNGWKDVISIWVVLAGGIWGYINLTTMPNPYGYAGIFMGITGIVVATLIFYIRWLRYWLK
jgi:hypothetical protein